MSNPAGIVPCQAVITARIKVKVLGYGAFIGCSNFPKCKFTRNK